MSKLITNKQLKELIQADTKIKIAINDAEHSAYVQNAIFEAGGSWDGTTTIRHESAPYLFVGTQIQKTITMATWASTFTSSANKEVVLGDYPKFQFQSQLEVLEYLINGGKVHRKQDDFYYTVADGSFCITNKYSFDASIKSTTSFSAYGDFSPYKEERWFTDIPGKGILCFAWDDDATDKILVVVTDYIFGDYYPVKTHSDNFKNARPATESEVIEYLYKK